MKLPVESHCWNKALLGPCRKASSRTEAASRLMRPHIMASAN